MLFVYVLRCKDGAHYVGHTDDVERREQAHNEGRGARHAAARRPVRVVYSEQFDAIAPALGLESESERQSREALGASATTVP